MPAGSDRAKTRRRRSLSIRTSLRRRQTADAFPAAILVSASTRYALADFANGARIVAANLEKDRCATAPHFLWPHRGPSAPAGPRLAKAINFFLSRRGRFGGHGQARLSQGDQGN